MTDEELHRHGGEIGQAIEDVIKKHVAEGMPLDRAFRAALGAIVYMAMGHGGTRRRLTAAVSGLVDQFQKNPPAPPPN